jgi:hypothetical protein
MMTETHEGGCLCGSIRYRTTGDPARVTTCYCRFCQRATGSIGLVEPVFADAEFQITTGDPKLYSVISESSGKQVHIHFCETCGTKIHLSFERFPGFVGLYGGTFDDPDWFDRQGEGAKHIFLSAAAEGTMIPPGVACFEDHALTRDGDPVPPQIHDEIHVIRRG